MIRTPFSDSITPFFENGIYFQNRKKVRRSSLRFMTAVRSTPRLADQGLNTLTLPKVLQEQQRHPETVASR